MPTPRHARTAVLILMLAASFASAQVVTQTPASQPAVTLKVGDPAPPLTLGTWIKGEPVKAFEPGKRYVLDFWATWCPECIEQMPHVSALQKQYPAVTFIGPAVQEEDPAAVRPFVAKQGDRMAYRVALDDVSKNPEGAMTTAWLMAAGINTLPSAIVVDDRRIAWIGRPVDLDRVLEKLAAGTFDPKAALAEQAKTAELRAAADAALAAKNFAGLHTAIEALAVLSPGSAETLRYNEVVDLARASPPLARERAKALMPTLKAPVMLAGLAVVLCAEADAGAPEFALAHDAIERAKAVDTDGSKAGNILFASAYLAARQKNWTVAVDLQQKAVTAAPAEDKPLMQRMLDQYQNQTAPSDAK